MGYILEATMNYLILLVPLILVEMIVCYNYKLHKIKVGKGFIVAWQLLAYLMVTMFSVTNAAGIWEIGRYKTIIQLDTISLIPLKWGLKDLFGLGMNLVLFVPFGIAIPLMWKNYDRAKKTILTGAMLSLLIELSQLLNFRATDIDDLMMNTLGTAIGYGIWYFLFRGRWKIFQLDDEESSNWCIKHGGTCSVLVIFLFYFLIGSGAIYKAYGLFYGF